MPFTDLAAQYDALRAVIDARIRGVLGHGQFIMGPEVGELERTLGSYVGTKHAIGCASDTDGLLLALMALGVGPGDAVLTTPFTFIATAEVIALLGATPVFVDIDPDTYNLDPGRVEAALLALAERDRRVHPLPSAPATLTPKGVIAVDLYGLPADYDSLRSLCATHGLFLLEDAAQSFGGRLHGRRACSFGDAAVTSFFPAKPLGGYGDGGMVFTDDDALADAMRSIRIHGKGRDKYDNVRIGLNARLDTLQAAIVLAKFEAFPEELAKRQAAAQLYGELLGAEPSLCVPTVPGGYSSAWAQYTVRVGGGRRDVLQGQLRAADIPSAVYYPMPLHLQGAFRHLGYSRGDFPLAELASAEVLSLPFGPYLSEGDLAACALGALRALESP
ncbi:MAG: DegT/DnrJ/EryC1/StrS family aminotransferase [Deltaproteobacteria bacterium]|nr:DegT/DnrJ/EryC1/StrS family aminotransferase [Deltaproteobacteria bacterium]